MADPFFFGYGSLVNRATHDFPQAARARLSGWRRTWRHTAHHPTAFLTAEPAPGVEIEGLVAHVPGGDWQALDAREAGYDRVPVTPAVAHEVGRSVAVEVYTIPEAKHPAPPRPQPILLSYLDVVVQGFWLEFGEAGVARFFETTTGWDTPIQDDRAKPLYPRAQVLTPAQRALVDTGLARVNSG